VDAISAAYNAQALLKVAGCQRLVITIDRDMEWIPRVLCRYYDMVERADEDPALLHQFLRYPEQMRHLMEFIDSFESVTNIKLQFWPTEKQELSGAYLWANTAIDQAMSNYEREYYGVFDDSDCGDYYEDEEEYDDNATISDEELEELEEPEDPKETAIPRIDVHPEIATETLADRLGNAEEGINEIPILAEETANMKRPEVTLPAGGVTCPKLMLSFDQIADVSGIDYSFSGHDGNFAYVLAQVSFGTTNFEEILLSPPFLEAASLHNTDEASRLVMQN